MSIIYNMANSISYQIPEAEINVRLGHIDYSPYAYISPRALNDCEQTNKQPVFLLGPGDLGDKAIYSSRPDTKSAP